MTISTPYKPMPIQAQEHSPGNVPVHFLQYQFTTIVHNWTAHLQYKAWQITRNKQVAEDIVQEAFLVLWQQREKIIPENPVGWLIKVVYNLSVRYMRDRNIQLRIQKTLNESQQTSCTETEDMLIIKEKYNLLNNIFHQLPAQQKMVLHLSKEKGWKRAEIAAFLQLSPDTVRVHLYRAVQFMKANFVCISLFVLLFIFNNIFFKRSSTKEPFMVFFTGYNPINATIAESIQNIELSD